MSIPYAIARAVKPMIPTQAYRALHMYVARRNANRWLASRGVFPLARRVAEHFHYTVQAGPFKGMQYTQAAVHSRPAPPSLLGRCERQLYPFLMEAASRSDLVVDIGSAEGYYAVGMAMLGHEVVTFDVDAHERKVCKEMAEVNRVQKRVSVRSWCDPASLPSLVKNRRALVFSDIDGGELDLFTPEVITATRHCDLIIELHGANSEENASFAARFGTDALVLDNPPFDRSAAERIKFLGEDAPRMAAEYRSFQQWLVRPRLPRA